MKMYMGNQAGVDSSDDFADKLCNEYDMLIKRGSQTVNNVMIQKGNVDLMKTLLKMGLKQLQMSTQPVSIIDVIGKSIVGYWTGATLNNFPPPIIPAPGTIQNIAITSATVTNPGNFPSFGNQLPTDSKDLLVNLLASAITIHLTTVSGIYITVSIYPSTPPMSAPAVLQWTGYTIP